ncbi:phospholipase A [Helicobacter cinaedi]|uniref:Phosphatidylcholine 1-acylhydrolase n=1 Tax=Helicobacter cinaedi TaxID=213 RepID=A0A377JRE8_9HELI|nr:phospholipase A [Helicobacter cinaedi]STP10404.1 phospholipase A [Helicobacter cinaedi]
MRKNIIWRVVFCVFAMCCAVWGDESQTHSQNAENENPADKSLELLSQVSQNKQQDDKKTESHDVSNAVSAITEDSNFSSHYLALYRHKSVYILPFYHSFSDPAVGNNDTETKFQFSFKMPVIKGHFSPYGSLYFAYTQTAWFQNYNKEDSRPFRDIDYQPELFYSYEAPIAFLGGAIKDISFGYNHTSNGERALRSRTQNRLLLRVLWEYDTANKGTFGIRLGAWAYIGTNLGGFLHDNRDLPLYRGYNDLHLYYKTNKHLLELYMRPPVALRYYPYVELGYTLRISKNMGIYCQYVNGYGDNLFEYKMHSHRLGLGFRLWNSL